MKRTAVLGVIVGAFVVGAALVAVVQEQSFSGPTIVFVVLGAAMLAVSVRMPAPSYSRRLTKRMAALEATLPELRNQQIIRLNRKALVALVVVLLIEVLISIEVWPLREWQSWIAAMLGVTLLFIALFAAITVRAKMGRY